MSFPIASVPALSPKPVSPLPPIKLSAPHTGEFWILEILHEDARILAVNKPARLLVSPDRYDPRRPNLMRLLTDAVSTGKPWAVARGLTYLANAHRLDFETTGVLLLAKDKPALVALANHFGSEVPKKTYLALVTGNPTEDRFECDLALKPDPRQPGLMRWARDGKKSFTEFVVRERFRGCALVECHPRTGRTHQLRVHLKAAGHPILADPQYGDGAVLRLSDLKRRFKHQGDTTERPLTPSLALHAWKLAVPHPDGTGETEITAPWPKDFEVALKYLRRYAAWTPAAAANPPDAADAEGQA